MDQCGDIWTSGKDLLQTAWVAIAFQARKFRLPKCLAIQCQCEFGTLGSTTTKVKAVSLVIVPYYCWINFRIVNLDLSRLTVRKAVFRKSGSRAVCGPLKSRIIYTVAQSDGGDFPISYDLTTFENVDGQGLVITWWKNEYVFEVWGRIGEESLWRWNRLHLEIAR